MQHILGEVGAPIVEEEMSIIIEDGEPQPGSLVLLSPEVQAELEESLEALIGDEEIGIIENTGPTNVSPSPQPGPSNARRSPQPGPSHASHSPQPGPSNAPRLPQPGTPESPRLHRGRKDMNILRSSHRSPSPVSSEESQSSQGGRHEDWSALMREELAVRAEEDRRRAAWKRRADEELRAASGKLQKTRDLISALKGEEKSIRNQKEALREQMRQLDNQEHSLDRRKRSALLSLQRYEVVVAQFNEIMK